MKMIDRQEQRRERHLVRRGILGEDNAFKFLMALGILHRYREGTRSGALGRGAQLIFGKSLWLKVFTQGSADMASQ